MSIPTGFQSFNGKQNLMASFNNYLIENILGGHLGVEPLPSDKEFFWAFNYPIAPQHFPAITVTEKGLFNLGEQALDQLLGFTASGDPIYGSKNQTLIEITCISKDTDSFGGATNQVYNLRDRVVHALTTDIIPLRNYYDSNKPQLGVIYLDPESNAINEKFVVDSADQNIKRYILLVRIFWIEQLQFPKVQTITSNATVS